MNPQTTAWGMVQDRLIDETLAQYGWREPRRERLDEQSRKEGRREKLAD